MKKNTYTFIDFFCGAGGFSEGFRQQGFTPILGIEKWSPALQTHNLNFGLNDSTKDVLDFESDEEIENLPDSHILLGSPPCVSFSMANKSGKADKSLGIRLIEAYLRVVAVKKHKPDSILIAWYMENVPNSRNFVKESYTFSDLNLSHWAKKNNLNPNDIALNVKEQGDVFNSSHYGSSQKRERFISGEYIPTGEFLSPVKTHNKNIRTLGSIRKNIPSPLNTKNEIITDPNYPSIKMNSLDLTDNFYDTGIYEIEWKKARRAKVNHPFGGIMSFPESNDKPCRTIMATKSASTRESLIFESEYNRSGNGQYRTPTIREIATFMGFPYLFNFTGTESNKWKQIGNAVVPQMSAALAKSLRKKLIGDTIPLDKIDFNVLKKINKAGGFNNLNSFKEKEFNNSPKRKMNSKFRRHILKGGNLTVELLNYSPIDKTIPIAKEWEIYVFSGTGGKFKIEHIDYNIKDKLEKYILNNFIGYENFIKDVKTLVKNVPSAEKLQNLYADYNLTTKDLDLDTFFELAETLIEKYKCTEIIHQPFIKEKKNIPTFQLLSLYLIASFRSAFK